jgi:hypothetical protein
MLKKIGFALLFAFIVSMGLSAEPKWHRLGYKSQEDFRRNYQSDLAKKKREYEAKIAQIQALKKKQAQAKTPAEKNQVDAEIQRAEAQLQMIIIAIQLYNSAD